MRIGLGEKKKQFIRSKKCFGRFSGSETTRQPVLHAIPELAELGPVKEHQPRFAALQQERDLLKAQLEVSEKVGITNQSLLETMRGAIDRLGQQLSENQREEAEVELSSLSTMPQRAEAKTKATHQHHVTVDPEALFVLMPFSVELEPVYETIAPLPGQPGLRSHRADAITEVGPIIDQISRPFPSPD
jgi:hypothetical protein